VNQTVTNPEAAGFGVIGAREDVPSSAASTADTCIYCITGQRHPRWACGKIYSCEDKPVYACEPCNYITTTKGNVTIHTHSIKHSRNMKKLQINRIRVDHDSHFTRPKAIIPARKGITKSAVKVHSKVNDASSTKLQKLKLGQKMSPRPLPRQQGCSSSQQHISMLSQLQP
jgi:hypothetical protein